MDKLLMDNLGVLVDQSSEEYELIELEASDTESFDLQTIKVEPVEAKTPMHCSNISETINNTELNEDELKENIGKLLNLLIDEETLSSFGWPSTPVQDVLCAVIKQCDQSPADDRTCPDFVTKLRENVKLLFTSVLDDESVTAMLNNYSVDHVIMHVLKL